MYIIKNFLTEAEVNHILSNIKEGWQAGYTKSTEAHKNNYELIEEECAQKIASKIQSHKYATTRLFIKNMTLPRFNLYKKGQYYKKHIDAFKQLGVQTDWSYTLMLHPAEDGGELEIEIDGQAYKVPLEQGDIVIYQSGNIHQVLPVNKGKRIAAIGWIASLLPRQEERAIISNIVDTLEVLDNSKDKKGLLQLSYSYHNLMRLWSK